MINACCQDGIQISKRSKTYDFTPSNITPLWGLLVEIELEEVTDHLDEMVVYEFLVPMEKLDADCKEMKKNSMEWAVQRRLPLMRRLST